MRLARRTREKLDHRWTQRRASRYLDGELSARQRRRLEAHPGLCPDCGRAGQRIPSEPMNDALAGSLPPDASARSAAGDCQATGDAELRSFAAVEPLVESPATAAERQLVERAQGGDREAFEELVRRHADRLYAVVLRFVADGEEAEEVTQEAFLRAWRSIDRFQGRSLFFTWLYRIGINEAKRRAERRPPAGSVTPLEDSPLDDAPDWSEAPELRAEQGDLRRVLERAVRALPVEYRAPLILRDVEGLSTQEAAEVMELGEAAFKSRLHRARLAVRRALDEYFAEAER
jgi:RNA polymerase sigma-70 factor (ECF subfamily)